MNGALQIGRSAMLASQAGIQVAGNNMANAATPGYRRQVAGMTPARSDRIGPQSFVGTGVLLRDITRVVDGALQSRVRTALSREAGADIDRRFLSAIESLQNELGDRDLSSQLTGFLNAFSELANNPNDDAVRSVVLRKGAALADRIQGLRGDYARVRDEIDRSLAASVRSAEGILDRIATLNVQIAQTEQGAGQANGLRDARDQLVNELSALLDVSVVEQANGMLDVLVGSIPIVLGGTSRGIELRTRTEGNRLVVDVRVRSDGSILAARDGSVGALLRQRGETVDPAIDTLDRFAGQLIHQVNRIHSGGQGKVGWSSVVGTTRVGSTTDPLSSTAAALPVPIVNGSFRISTLDETSGLSQSAIVLVDPTTTSLDALASAINAAGLPSVVAVATTDGRLRIDAAAGSTVAFGEDSSGALAALGVNTFFAGRDARDIAVNADLLDDPRLLATGKDFVPGSNGTALAMLSLETTPVAALGGRTLQGFWQSSVSALGVRTAAASDAADGARLVRESLEAQEQAVSGVSIDEESIDLLLFQRQFQAAARFISTIDETLQTLLSIA
jgi:flagellar hook-associated protein 1 FlgK